MIKQFIQQNIWIVEVDKDGKVVGVWFRCMLLPFKHIDVDENRAAIVRSVYTNGNVPNLLAVEVSD